MYVSTAYCNAQFAKYSRVTEQLHPLQEPGGQIADHAAIVEQLLALHPPDAQLKVCPLPLPILTRYLLAATILIASMMIIKLVTLTIDDNNVNQVHMPARAKCMWIKSELAEADLF